MKKIKMLKEKNYLKNQNTINFVLLISVGLFFLSCAKNKELEKVYRTAETIERSSLVSTDDMYIYVPSTLQVPREQSDTRAFFQGDEKIVKFKYTEKNLEIFELDSDVRFRNNELNSSPVISIPVVYKDYKCITNAQNECSQKEEENNATEWSNKKFVLPNYSELKVNEINTLDLISVDPSCANLTNTKLINYEINSTTLNIELERTYQKSSEMRCIYSLYANDQLSNASFKVRYFYSFVKLNSVASADFKPFIYEKEDQRIFGFFKTEIKKLNNFFDFSRIEKQYLANHWNPERKSIDFYLDPKFYNKENKNLLDATQESFEKINNGLRQAGVRFELNIAGKATNNSGDIRFNRINLLDEPQASGLLGYGPTIANPLTGEILQAHVNMYSGVLTQTIRSTYESMVDLGHSDKAKGANTTSNKIAENSIFERIENYSKSQKLNLNNIATSQPLKMKANMSNTAKFNSILERELQKKADTRLASISNKGDENSLNTEEEKNNLIRANRKICDADLINFAKIAKKELSNIRNIPGVVSDEGKLIAWDLLSDEARQSVLDLILPKVYIQTLVHEMGHTLGLRHNFMGSFDKDNFYTEQESKELGLNTTPAYSSIMDYANSELNSLGILGKYDIAALRYMYSRKVETKNGQMADVKTSISDMNKVELKKYLFCTDENAGLSSTCNRFDEGSTLTEVALSQSEAYDTNYKYSYFRNGRTKFDIYGVDSLTRRKYADFQRARQIFEDYELFSGLVGKEILETGCPANMIAQYPVCTKINDIREATLVIARMFLNIIKTPDLTCYVENLSGENINKKEMVNLSAIIEKTLRYTMDHTPSGCFDPAVVEYFTGKDQKILAQGGKFLNSVKEINPKFAEFSSDISIRGNFQDKLLAIQFLVTRYLGVNGTESVQGSMMDIKSVSDEVNNYFAHLINGEKLINPVQFTDENGKKIDVEYSLSNDVIIPEASTQLISRYFGFPENSNVEFNRLAISTAKRFSKSNDVEYRARAQAFCDSLTVVQANKFNLGYTDINSNDLSVTKIDSKFYLAASENVLAQQMINSINTENFLETVDKRLIVKIMSIKHAKVEFPDSFSAAQTTFSNLPPAMRIQLFKFKKDKVPLSYEILVPQVGEANAKTIMIAYALSADQMNEILSFIAEKTTLGEDATETERKIFALDSDIVDQYFKGTLTSKNKAYIKSLDIMSPL